MSATVITELGTGELVSARKSHFKLRAKLMPVLSRNSSGDWEIESGASYEKVAATKVKFLIQLQPREKTTSVSNFSFSVSPDFVSLPRTKIPTEGFLPQ